MLIQTVFSVLVMIQSAASSSEVNNKETTSCSARHTMASTLSTTLVNFPMKELEESSEDTGTALVPMEVLSSDLPRLVEEWVVVCLDSQDNLDSLDSLDSLDNKVDSEDLVNQVSEVKEASVNQDLEAKEVSANQASVAKEVSEVKEVSANQASVAKVASEVKEVLVTVTDMVMAVGNC